MKIPENVLAVLSQCTVVGLFVYLPEGQLDRKLYVAVNKVLEGLGGTWNRKAQAHVFTVDPAEGLDRAILTGEITSAADLGWFPTPPDLAAEVIKLARIKRGMTVLEPSAGLGALTIPALALGAKVDACEIDAVRYAELRKLSPDHDLVVLPGDFLEQRLRTEHVGYDRVVMNPPFARQQDIAHVRHAFDFLKPGGRLVSIMSASAFFREDKKARDFRVWLLTGSAGFEWRRNADDAFKTSGTNVRTYTLTLDKP